MASDRRAYNAAWHDAHRAQRNAQARQRRLNRIEAGKAVTAKMIAAEKAFLESLTPEQRNELAALEERFA